MALINCPKCTKEISDKAVSCPACGCPAESSGPTAGEQVSEERNIPYSGGVSDFGMWNLIKFESMNSWWRWAGSRRRRRRNRGLSDAVLRGLSGHKTASVYETRAHSVQANRRIDKTKGQLTKIWMFGLFGTLGLHYFAAGRLLTGSMSFLWGALWWIISVILAFDPQMQEYPRLFILFAVLLFVPPLISLIRIRLGKFRDVFRNYIT